MTTIGVSIAIPEPYAASLQAVRSAVGDPLADKVPPHITLLPPTDIAGLDSAGFADYLRELAADWSPFTIMLRGTGTFRPVSPVVFVAVAIGIPLCEQLQEQVRSGPIDRDLQFTYHPHVTVAHNVEDRALDQAFHALADYTCEFVVDGFELSEQIEGERWRLCERFSFGGSGVVGPFG